MKNFNVTIREVPQAIILDLYGEITSAAQQRLSTIYDQVGKSHVSLIILNFTHVDYINSTGIALIVHLLIRARRAQYTLLAYGLSEHYIEIFTITRLSDFMSIFPDEASALAEVRRLQP